MKGSLPYASERMSPRPIPPVSNHDKVSPRGSVGHWAKAQAIIHEVLTHLLSEASRISLPQT